MALISFVSGAVQSDMPPLAQASEREASLPWWAWLLIVMILAWLLVRWLNRRPTQDATQSTRQCADAIDGPTATTATGPAPIGSGSSIQMPPAQAVIETPLVSAVDSTPAAIETPPVRAEPASTAVIEAPPVPVAEPLMGAVVETPAVAIDPAPVKPDDLTIVEGIGPKISALLVRSGIRTFGELAATDVERLRQILHEVGYRVNDPTTWPEQGRLAAAGDWDRLQALQDALKGGRRV